MTKVTLPQGRGTKNATYWEKEVLTPESVLRDQRSIPSFYRWKKMKYKKLKLRCPSLWRFVGVHWKEWCWGWNSNTLATSCEEFTHWTLMLGGIGGRRKRGRQDEMAGWHHRLDGCEFEWTPGDGDGQGGLSWCNSWSRKQSDTTEWLKWTELNWMVYEAEHLFICLFAICVSSLVRYLIICFVHFC